MAEQLFQAWSSCAGGRNQKTPTLGEAWAVGLNSFTMGNVLQAPNPKYPNCSAVASGVVNPAMIGLSSWHSGAPTSCSWTARSASSRDSTALQIVWSLGSMAQGEVIDASSF